MLPTDLTDILHAPDQREDAFQSDPSSFRRLHLSALRQHPDSETLLLWQAGLTYARGLVKSRNGCLQNPFNRRAISTTIFNRAYLKP